MKPTPTLILIAAVNQTRTIGHQNQLPWSIPSDLKYFKEKTAGAPVIMGHKTHDSIGKALPGRKNIVITKSLVGYLFATPAASLEEAIVKAGEVPEIFIIGGAQIYKAALDANLVDKMLITDVDDDTVGDTLFPIIDVKKWDLVKESDWVKGEKDQFRHRYLTFEKIKPIIA